MQTFQSVKYRTFRACLFASLGLWGIVPGLHALILYGRASQMRYAFLLDLFMGIFYLVNPPAPLPHDIQIAQVEVQSSSGPLTHVAKPHKPALKLPRIICNTCPLPSLSKHPEASKPSYPTELCSE